MARHEKKKKKKRKVLHFYSTAKKFRLLMARCEDDRVEQLRGFVEICFVVRRTILFPFFTGFLRYERANARTEADLVKLSKK